MLRHGGASGAIFMELLVDSRIAAARASESARGTSCIFVMRGAMPATACAVLAMMLRALERMCAIRDTLH